MGLLDERNGWRVICKFRGGTEPVGYTSRTGGLSQTGGSSRTGIDLAQELHELKRERNAVILATR